MKAMILAAGRGKRMMPLTADIPKPMLTIAGKPLLQYHIEALKSAGITELVINLAWCGDKIRAYFGDGADFGVSIEYSQEPEGGLETAGGIIKALAKLGETFVVVNGDIFCDYDFHSLTLLHLMPGEGHLVMVENPPHNPTGDFPLALAQAPQQNYTFAGIALYHKDFFASMEAGFIALGPLLRSALGEGKLSTELYLGQWWDIGTPERLQQLNEMAAHVG